MFQRFENAVHHHDFIFQILLNMAQPRRCKFSGWPLANDMSAMVFNSPSSKYRCLTGERTLQ